MKSFLKIVVTLILAVVFALIGAVAGGLIAFGIYSIIHIPSSRGPLQGTMGPSEDFLVIVGGAFIGMVAGLLVTIWVVRINLYRPPDIVRDEPYWRSLLGSHRVFTVTAWIAGLLFLVVGRIPLVVGGPFIALWLMSLRVRKRADDVVFLHLMIWWILVLTALVPFTLISSVLAWGFVLFSAVRLRGKRGNDVEFAYRDLSEIEDRPTIPGQKAKRLIN